VMVLSVDMGAKRISLSMKAAIAPPEPEAKPGAPEGAAGPQPAEPPKPKKKPAGPLLGGLGRSPGAERLGLKW
jgi:hypothetical protein